MLSKTCRSPDDGNPSIALTLILALGSIIPELLARPTLTCLHVTNTSIHSFIHSFRPEGEAAVHVPDWAAEQLDFGLCLAAIMLWFTRPPYGEIGS